MMVNYLKTGLSLEKGIYGLFKIFLKIIIRENFIYYK
jgi:hypothetical protein